MKDENINNTHSGKRILISPLDWGLGHATRLIPIIRYLKSIGCVPVIAADGETRQLLNQEFPELAFVQLPGFNVTLTKQGKWLVLKLLSQLPTVLIKLRREYLWTRTAVHQYKIDGIISDNRPTFYHKNIPSVYITHQLQIYSPHLFLRKIGRIMHQYFINKFSQCWVPDVEGKDNFAGLLSHPSSLPKTPVSYLGPLSRFTAAPKNGGGIVAILSGPEPQRSLLQELLIEILQRNNSPATIVVGRPGKAEGNEENGQLTIINHLSATALEQLLSKASLIVARAGYSTIMDLICLQKQAILIPTPGQSEQEYLSSHLQYRDQFVFVQQEKAKIESAIAAFKPKVFSAFPISNSNLSETIHAFVRSL